MSRQIMKLGRGFTLLTAAVLVTACTSEDAVTFVTATSISIVDADATTQAATIGYDRIEGVYAPVYGDGEIPPVFADIKSDLAVFNPKISQTYGTGNAALIATGRKVGPTATENYEDLITMSERGERFYFTTLTTYGLNIGLAASKPANLNLGYKRVEASYIPVREAPTANNPHNKKYMSVFARLASDSGTFGDAAEPNQWPENNAYYRQIFATGAAADKLASNNRPKIQKMGRDALIGDAHTVGRGPSATLFIKCGIEHPEFQTAVDDYLGSQGMLKDVDRFEFIESNDYENHRSDAWPKVKDSCPSMNT